MKRFLPFIASLPIGLAAPITGALLFREDLHVEEIHDGLDLRKYLQSVVGPPKKHSDPDRCQKSAFIMLYSSWCPHCHAFQPVWSSLAARLNCTQNVDKIRIGAFECVANAEDRRVPTTRWKEVTGTDFKFSSGTEGTPDEILPTEVCASLLHQTYPTLLLATPKECEAQDPWTPFQIGSGGLAWKENFPVEAEMYHIVVESHSTAADDIVEALDQEKIAQECEPRSHQKAESTKRIADYLREAGRQAPKASDVLLASSHETDAARWDERAQSFDAHKRLYDGILGIYHVLGSWVPSEGTNLSPTLIDAVSNMLLLSASAFPSRSGRQQLVKWALMTRETQKAPTVAEMKQHLIANVPWPDAVDQPQQNSKLCRTSSCHVWTLFHTLFTVMNKLDTTKEGEKQDTIYFPMFDHTDEQREALLQKALKSALQERTVMDRLSMRGHDAAATMHQIVWGFFTCRSCRDHFHKGYEGCLADRCEWVQKDSEKLKGLISDELEELPPKDDISVPYVSESLALKLWLWRFHNIVNVRTATDKAMMSLRTHFETNNSTEGLEVAFIDQDVRVPTLTQCIDCRHSRHSTPKPQDDSAPADFVAPQQLIDAAWMLQFLESNENEDAMPYDVIDDFSLVMVDNFLTTFYTDPAWHHLHDDLVWQDSKFTGV